MTSSPTSPPFEQQVRLKYQLYNSLFLTLPFDLIHRTGTTLPLLAECCMEGYQDGMNPDQILVRFFNEYFPEADAAKQTDVLFNFVKYIERQVVLFDAVEEAAFDEIHDLEGPGTLDDFLARVDRDFAIKKLRNKLEDFRLRIVLTAHPTQFYPGTVLGIITDLAESIRSNDVVRVKELLLQLGKTPFINEAKPTPLDEARSLIWYLKNVFYDAIPEVVGKLRGYLDGHGSSLPADALINLGFWPGGDRDGNPFVNTGITMQTMALLHRAIASCYHRDARELRRRLTFKGVHEKIVHMEYRLFDSVHHGERAYRHIDELVQDIDEISTQLHTRHDGLFSDSLDAFRTRVLLFGFHFACLDIRQDSRKHAALIEMLLDRAGLLEQYQKANEEGKIKLLHSSNLRISETEMPDELSHDIIGSINAISVIQEKYGLQACHRYIISNARDALDVVILYTLIRWTAGSTTHVDIVPLFESIDTLGTSGEVMGHLYNDPVYAAHLAQRDRRQTIMLGFSDGTKDGGYLRANWSIFTAKEDLSTSARAHDVKVVFFDGRGGPPARGGGNTHKFYSSLGATIDNHEVQLTVQGQTISSHYGSRQGAMYNLEQLFTAGLEQSLFRKSKRFTPEQRHLMSRMAETGYQKYLDLKTRPEFLRYLEEVGTLKYYGETNIGSRPVKRGGKSELTLEDLRAIPFVSSWSQLKQNIPGYYGFGAALAEEIGNGRIKEVRQLYRSSRFFQTLVGNSMQALSKSFFPLTAYLEDDQNLGKIWSLVHDEYLQTLQHLLKISGQKALLEDNPDIQQSISIREAIILPVLTIQQAAIQRLRTGDIAPREAEVLRKLILRTMYGIINAGRNSA